MESIMRAIRAIRNRRSEMNVPPSKKCDLYVVTDNAPIYEEGASFITRLAYAERVLVSSAEPDGHEDMAAVVTPDAKLYMPLAQLVDVEKELSRVAKELANAKNDIVRAEGMLNNEKFVSKAPEAVIAQQRAKLESARKLVKQLEESEARLRKLQ